MILIIFGSKSDERIYTPLLDGIREKEIEYDLFIASAHKSPGYVEDILDDVDKKYKLIIAGAGLAAHLPGVIASKTIRPVIGIPIDVNFSGMDSLLSIIQMPPSVPVLSVGIDEYNESVKNSTLILKKYDKVNILHKNLFPEGKLKKVLGIFSDFNIKFEYNTIVKVDCININPVELGHDVDILENCISVNIPVSSESNMDDLKKLSDMTKIGLWVGLNRFDNAAISAIQLLNFDDEYSKKLIKFKKNLEESFRNA